MKHEFQMLAKTFKGLEQVLAGELISLGANDVQVERRAVSFTGDMQLMYKANLWLRTASRILRPIAVFKAKDADEVYEEVRKIDWEQYMTADTSFAIDSTVYSETFNHSRYVTYRVKDAIADLFKEKYGKRPNVKIDGADLLINVHISHEQVTVSLDSSGESLHKRGWRTDQTAAPINEALAAGLLMLAGWKGQTDFVDPMCGSGTFLIEAAMIALNIPPGIYRHQGFAFEKWRDFDRDLFQELYDDDSQEKTFEHHIYGSDAAFYAIKVAEKNIRSAGLTKYISLHQCRLQELKNPSQNCLLLTNPPYGERLEKIDIMSLYEDIGSMLKHKFSGSEAWLISSNIDATKRIGLRPSEKIKVLNGELECIFLKYELFAGERKEFVKLKESRNERDFSKDRERHNKRDFSKRKDNGKKDFMKGEKREKNRKFVKKDVKHKRL